MTSFSFALYEEKVALETSYSEKIQDALDGLYGKNRFIVRVDVSLSNPRYQVKHTKEANAKRSKKNQKISIYYLATLQLKI